MSSFIRTAFAALTLCLAAGPALAQDDIGAELNQLVGQADEATAQGEHETAIDYLTQALTLELRPVERYQLLVIRGNAYQRAGEPAQAAADWRTALETGAATRKDHDALLAAIAGIWADLDNRDKVRRIVDNWDSDIKPIEAPMFWLARELTVDGEYDEALKYARPLVEIPTDNRTSYLKFLMMLLTIDERNQEMDQLIGRFEEECTAILDVPDADAEPVIRVAVDYPRRAAYNNWDGYCDMTFDIDRKGEPENINADCDRETFKRASVKTVEQWKYLPKIVAGSAVQRQGVQTRLTYQMQRLDGPPTGSHLEED